MGIFNRLSGINWITSVFSPLVIIMMEVSVIYSWLVWFGEWPASGVQQPALSLASLIILFCISYIVTRFLLRSQWSIGWIQLSIIGGGLLAIMIAVRIDYTSDYGLFDGGWFVFIGNKILTGLPGMQSMLIAFLVGVFIWWRGIRWGRSRLQTEEVYRSFLVGTFALIFLIVIWGLTLGSDSLIDFTSTTGFYIIGYFLFGLLALSLGNLRFIQGKIVAKEGTGTFMSRRWVAIILGVIAVIICIGIGLSAIFSRNIITVVGQGINNIADWLYDVIYYVLLPFSYISHLIQWVMRWIIDLLMSGEPVEPMEFEWDQELEETEEIIRRGLPPEAIMAIKWIIFALIVGLVIFILARAVRRIMSSGEYKDIEQVDESLFSWDGLKTDLKLLFSQLGNRFRRGKRIPVGSMYDDTEGGLNIREIYQRLLWESSQLKIGRKDNETPYEYAVRFRRTIPESSEYLNELTNVYIDVRYGDIQVKENQIKSANNLWSKLKNLLRKLQHPNSN